MSRDKTILILGGAGQVGTAIVRELGRQLQPTKLILSSLSQHEVEALAEGVRHEFPDIEFVPSWGNVFVRSDLRETSRGAILADSTLKDQLYHDLFGNLDTTYEESSLIQLIREHRPDVIIDCINTATAISYQDVESISKKTYDSLNRLDAVVDGADSDSQDALAQLRQDVQTLLISQGTSQLIRHVRLLHTALKEVGTRLYLKVGTTGTGGMGLNIPYTHSEDKPSVQLMTKAAMAFAHTGLLFLMARTPDGPLVKELKPAGMIGYRRVSYEPVKHRGELQYRYASHEQKLGDALRLHESADGYDRLGELRMAGVDTGENGFFARGEFETITYIDQMEFLTPEEIAEAVVLEVKGSNTGYDVIAGLDSNIMNPTYRAGILRQTALRGLESMEARTGSHSIALGQLGPPELSKLLYESHLLKLIYRTLRAVRDVPSDTLAASAYRFVLDDDELRHTITSIGLPILAPDGTTILRGPRINIPESIYDDVSISDGDIDRWARKGWVDLRPSNMLRWQERFARMQAEQHQLQTVGSASIDRRTYLHDTIEIGAVVAWIFANEEGGYRIK